MIQLFRMKTLGFLLSILLSSSIVHGGDVTLAWNSSEGATGYTLYYGTVSGEYLEPIDVGNVTTHTITLSPDLWYLAIDAYNECGHSQLSVEVTTCISPEPPAQIGVE